MCRPILNGLLRITSGDKTVNQTTSKTITTSNTVKNFKVSAIDGFVKVTVRPENSTPIVYRGRLYAAQRGRSNLKIWKFRHG